MSVNSVQVLLHAEPATLKGGPFVWVVVWVVFTVHLDVCTSFVGAHVL